MEDLRTSMDRELKSSVVPRLREAGFSGSFPHFRRSRAEVIDLLTFQFDRNGGGFVVELARSSKDGLTTHWGKHIPGNKVSAWDFHPSARHRIQPRMGSGTDCWFRFDHGQVAAAAEEFLKNLPFAEQWLREAQPYAAADGFAAPELQR
jgi:hypothetical protein